MKKFNLYIHIPFCQRICIYCDFYVSTARKLQGEFTDALLGEIALYKQKFPDAQPETVYFGGGTPSILSEEYLTKINEGIRSSFDVISEAEITLECNPNDLTPVKLKTFRDMGVNRLSIGVQSFQDDELKFLTRNHTSGQAKEGIQNARNESFTNISLDLIFGLPGQSPDNWKQNIDAALAFEPEHISVYNLTIEERTYLHKMVHQRKIEMPDENIELDMFLTAIEKLTRAGYEHYEISNYAKPGLRSKHNGSYWMGNHYLGLGPSAHSFDGERRWWNVRDIKKYCDVLRNDNKWPVDVAEELSVQQKCIEYLFLNLRKREGLDIRPFEKLGGFNFYEKFNNSIEKAGEFIICDVEWVKLSNKGLFLYNKICEEFVSAL